MSQPGTTWWTVLLCSGLALAPAQGQDAPLQQVVRDAAGHEAGRVDWLDRTVAATGWAHYRADQPRRAVERAAQAEAYANLARAARAARVDGQRLVEQLAAGDGEFRDYLSAEVRYAELGPLVVREDGWATVDATAPLFGIHVEGDQRRLRLGTEVYQRDDVWAHEVTPTTRGTGGYSGVILDARERGAAGAFAPTVRDTTGRVVWQVECASRELADQAGAVEYSDDYQAERHGGRAGDRPLVLRVLGVTADCDLVVSVIDGAILAPPSREASWPGIRFAVWDLIRTITPVSPFQRAAVVSTPRPQAARSADGQA